MIVMEVQTSRPVELKIEDNDSIPLEASEVIHIPETNDEQELRLQKLEQMAITNKWYAPITVKDDVSILLVDDNNNAILADWKYEEV